MFCVKKFLFKLKIGKFMQAEENFKNKTGRHVSKKLEEYYILNSKEFFEHTV